MVQNNEQSKNGKLNEFIQVATKVFGRARLPQHSAMMAYYALLSLFPLLLVVANVIPLFPIDPNELLNLTASILPENINSIVEPILLNYLESGSGGAITIGLITALWSASALVSNLRVIFNEIYGLTDIGRNFILARILSPLIFLVIFMALAVLVFLFIFGESIISMVESFIGIDFVMIEWIFSLRTPVLFIALLIVFSLIYQLVPDIKIPYKYAFPGAIVSTIGMMLLSELFTLYITFSNSDALSNAAIGSFVALMLYLYFIFMIVLFGAIVNAVFFEIRTDESIREATINQKEQDQDQKSTENIEKTVLQRKLTKVFSEKNKDTE